jgi:hypothetical protein
VATSRRRRNLVQHPLVPILDRTELREAVEAIVRDLVADGFGAVPAGGAVLRGGDIGRFLLYLAGEHGPFLREALPALVAAAELTRDSGAADRDR